MVVVNVFYCGLCPAVTSRADYIHLVCPGGDQPVSSREMDLFGGSTRWILGKDHSILTDLFEKFAVFPGIAQVQAGSDKADRPQAVPDRRGVGVSVYSLGAAADNDGTLKGVYPNV